MRTYSLFVSTALAITSSASAMTDVEYQHRSARLHANQESTEAVIGRLGAGVGFSPITPPSAEGDEKTRPLFKIHAALSPSKIVTGKLLYGRLLNRLVVGPDGSPALVVLDDNQGSLSGVRVMGMARQAGTAGRLTFELNKLLSRTGRAIAMQATALDSAGAFGIEAQVFSGKALAVGGAMASSFVSGLAASQQTQNISALGFAAPQTTGRNALIQGLAQTAADQSKRLIDEATAEKPVLVVEADTPVVVLVQEEVRL